MTDKEPLSREDQIEIMRTAKFRADALVETLKTNEKFKALVRGYAGVVEVCGICDIAGCAHIRKRNADRSPDPDTKMRCAECWCDDGECKWIATGNETEPEPVLAERAAIREAALREAAEIACTLGVYPELNVYGGGPEWYRHGKNIAAAILSLIDKGAG